MSRSISDLAAHRQQKREGSTDRIARAGAISAVLAQVYPKLEVPLEHQSTFQLLVAVILSAQCTDAAVNRVTPELFRRFPTAAELAQSSTEEIESLIRTLGLFRAKAKSLTTCARQLVEKFHGQIPATIDELVTLAGVGRKTANVILGHAFGLPGIIVDTHCKRLARRLRLTRSTRPDKIERDLNRILPPDQWTAFSHLLIIHGRRICHALTPQCRVCVLNQLCPSMDLKTRPSKNHFDRQFMNSGASELDAESGDEQI